MCALKACGRIDLPLQAPGLEQTATGWTCVLCYLNPTRFKQPTFKKRNTPPPIPDADLARPAQKQEIESDLYGERD